LSHELRVNLYSGKIDPEATLKILIRDNFKGRMLKPIKEKMIIARSKLNDVLKNLYYTQKGKIVYL